MRRKSILPDHKGADFIILGGAPSLHDELKRCPTDAVRIGVNHRAIKFYPVDYVVYLDEIALPWVKAITDKPTISPLWRADYHIPLKFVPINSGIASVHYAVMMGAKRIFCCGMDFYQGEVDYVDGGSVRANNKLLSYGDKCAKQVLSLARDCELIRFSWW